MNSCPITQWGRCIKRWSSPTSYPAAISGRGRIWKFGRISTGAPDMISGATLHKMRTKSGCRVFYLEQFFLHLGCICHFVSLFLVVSTGAIDCLERLVSGMTCCMSSWTLNPTHSLTLINDDGGSWNWTMSVIVPVMKHWTSIELTEKEYRANYVCVTWLSKYWVSVVNVPLCLSR